MNYVGFYFVKYPEIDNKSSFAWPIIARRVCSHRAQL